MNATKASTWMAGAIAFGWLATAASAFVLPGGHPPAAFVFGEGMVLASFVIAPIGAGAAAIGLWQMRRQPNGTLRLPVAMLALNLLFLAVALTLWFWILWEASRR